MPFRTPQIFPILEDIGQTSFDPDVDSAPGAIHAADWNNMARFHWVAKAFDIEIEGNLLINPEGTPGVTQHIVPFTYSGTIEDRAPHTSVLDLAASLSVIGANSLYRALLDTQFFTTDPLKVLTDPGNSSYATYKLRLCLSMGAQYSINLAAGSTSGTQSASRVFRAGGSSGLMDTSCVILASPETDGGGFGPYDTFATSYAAVDTPPLPLAVGGFGIEDTMANYALGAGLYTANVSGVSWSSISVVLTPTSRLTLP